MIADEIFIKMGENSERKKLMHQMKKYRKRENLECGKKSAEEIHQIFIDTHLNPDQDLFELNDDLPNNVLYIIESENEEVDEPMNENEDNNIEWDPAVEAVEIVDTM
ncbi:hypothetical protein RhiirC2_790878 [Rhizophagus irregularis]|uniref:Uncharacterized protein n=1 Tax=Rhizophagus irregularis TaxID=588596 RepID=A0A2N1MKC2_9GLOM|nr:hypothetical protein RhiirC2_793551 [Rhizophagus irregularis]PKK62094.1 hypothetical protein RhiirC2_790878 [Rhizophagus irregularis]